MTESLLGAEVWNRGGKQSCQFKVQPKLSDQLPFPVVSDTSSEPKTMLAFISVLGVSTSVVGRPRLNSVNSLTQRRVSATPSKPSRSFIVCCESNETSSTSPSSSKSPPSTKSSEPASSDETEETRKPPFEIRGFSLANVFLSLGGIITITSFSSYLSSSGTSSATSIGFVYGVPVLLIGCALKYAELQPIPVDTDEKAKIARLEKGTATQQQIQKDITRHRYGDEAHLSDALSSLELIPRGEPCPILERGVEREVDGEYEIELIFYSVATPYRTWEERIERCERFFGPDVKVSVRKVDAEKRLVGLAIRSAKQD